MPGVFRFEALVLASFASRRVARELRDIGPAAEPTDGVAVLLQQTEVIVHRRRPKRRGGVGGNAQVGRTQIAPTVCFRRPRILGLPAGRDPGLESDRPGVATRATA